MGHFLYLIGKTLVNGENQTFAEGYHTGWQFFQATYAKERMENPVLASELYDLCMSITSVRHSGIWNAGYITGFYAALFATTDSQLRLTRVEIRGDEDTRRHLEESHEQSGDHR